jgi:hypothetical protein
LLLMRPSCDVGDAEVPRLAHHVRCEGRLAGSIPRLSAHAPGTPDEVGRGLLGRAEAEG